MNRSEPTSDLPITVDVIQKIKSGCEAEFEQVLTDLTEAAQAFEGHLGANIFRSSDRASPEYRIVFKFNHLSNLQQWEASAMRRQLLERAKRLTVGDLLRNTLRDSRLIAQQSLEVASPTAPVVTDALP